MTPSRSYIIRALNEWILDNELTPYIVVDASLPDVEVPRDFVSNGQIVLNISPNAVKALLVGNDYLEFNARFGGVPQQVVVPILAILAIYAKENGQGMVFGSEPGGSPDPSGTKSLREVPKEKSDEKSLARGTRPSLKVVK